MPQLQQRFCKQNLSETHNRIVICYNTAPCDFYWLTEISCLPPRNLIISVFTSPMTRVVCSFENYISWLYANSSCLRCIYLSRMNDVQISWMSVSFWCGHQVDLWGRLLKTHSFINTLRPIQNGRHFADDIFKCIFLNEKVSIAIKISLKFVFPWVQLTIFLHWFR